MVDLWGCLQVGFMAGAGSVLLVGLIVGAAWLASR